MKSKDLKISLRDVLTTQATSYEYTETMEFILSKCIEYGADDYYVDKHDNIYVTKGVTDAYPCVVSHTDTVHDIYKGYRVYEVEGNFVAFDTDKMQQVGTGGDDKVGIWVCLEMLKHFDNIKVCFFSQEEIGCVGSSKADKEFFKDVAYAFECDRKGNKDFVQTSSGIKMFGDEFKKLISPTLKSYGYSITDGGLTDVHELAQDMGIACANMSCGYYRPHSNQEYVNIDDAIHTCNLVRSLITSLGEVRYEHTATSDYNTYLGAYDYYGYGAYGVKPKKKAKITSTYNSWCNDCGSIEKSSCDFCNKGSSEGLKSVSKEPSSKECACGFEARKYTDNAGSYLHCSCCGFYEDCSPF